jgi:hypothetical protein
MRLKTLRTDARSRRWRRRRTLARLRDRFFKALVKGARATTRGDFAAMGRNAR